MTKANLVFIPLFALAAVGLAGCHGNTDDTPSTAADKKAFLGKPDPAAQAADAARYAEHQKNVGAGGPPAPR